MTTTDCYQISPDFFDTIEKAKSKHTKHQTNPRYKNFNQTIFTAGDSEQFEEFRYSVSKESNVSIQEHEINEDILWDKYKNPGEDSVSNTFNYMFHKFKKGIYIKIQNGKLDVFLPFSNANFVNEWSDIININGFNDTVRKATETEGYKFNPKSINSNVYNWYANNCLVRYEYPVNESDLNVTNLKNMMLELCETQSVPDVEFFVNKRDFPLHKKDETEPYDNIWGDGCKLVSHNYDKFCPIFSMVESDEFADISIPTHNDWARVQSKENKWFEGSANDNFDDTFDKYKWEEKKNTAVFRGAATGEGVTISTNKRLMACYLSHNQKNLEGVEPLLDAGITKWKLRPRKLKNSKKLQIINTSKLQFGLSNFISTQEQSGYKYILHIPGNVCAFRLSLELASGSVVLITESKWKLWYWKMLEPYVHYIPIASDMSNLFEQIKWCRNNDSKCKEIAQNARKFYDEKLSKTNMLKVLNEKLVSISKHRPNYRYTHHPLEKMISFEKQNVVNNMKMFDTRKDENNTNDSRSFDFLKGNSDIIKKYISESSFEDILNTSQKIFSNPTTDISKARILESNCEIAIKSTDYESKKREIIHEAFIGINVTNLLIKKIPNFCYIFGMYENNDKTYLISEHVEGQTLQGYINSKEFSISDFDKILIQIALALNMAYKRNKFLHYDLTPWNIIIQKFNEPRTIEYEVEGFRNIKIETKLIPVIIDYGKSMAVVEGQTYKKLYDVKTDSSHDIITLILTCCKVVLSTRRPGTVFSKTISLINFLSGTGYLPYKINNSRSINTFLKKHGKFSQLLHDDKFDCCKKTYLDFVSYLNTK